MPLLWAHSEYVKLHRSVADGQVFDLVEAAHVANARMQSKIYKILSPDQKKSSATSNERRAQSNRIVGKGAITVKYRLEATRVTADADAEMVVPHGLDLTCKTTTLQATAQSLAASVLDLVATRAGEPAGSAIARSVELARHVEQLGYKRYWVAEHHAIHGLACSATPVLIGHIAAATETIRVGSGGVMLPNHAPLAVAEQFGTLEAIYPGRIDLGLGTSSGWRCSNNARVATWFVSRRTLSPRIGSMRLRFVRPL
jgi:luciferase-like monooxygenase